jgi:amino acid permease
MLGSLVLAFISLGLVDWPIWTVVVFFIVYLTIILFVIHYVRKRIYKHKTGFIKSAASRSDDVNDLLHSLHEVHRQLGHSDNP